MRPMFLPGVEVNQGEGGYAERARALRKMGAPVPQIFHLFAFKPHATDHLAQFTQEVMRGPSPLSAALRELIAAFTSKENQCPF